jgi:hypothetical protein
MPLACSWGCRAERWPNALDCANRRRAGWRTPFWVNMTKEEIALIAFLERDYGRPLTPEEIFLSLEQARAVGNLDD